MGAVRKIINSLNLVGINPGRLYDTLRGVPRFISDARSYSRKSDARFPLRLRHLKPILLDFHDDAGSAGGHYFLQDLWAARKVFERRPTHHIDVASRIDGFVAHVLVFMPVEVIDVRPLSSPVEGLRFVRADAMTMSAYSDDSIDSLSSLHAIEHFGLGRYSDPVNAGAYHEVMRSLARVLKPAGRLYFSVPVGRERVEFNAHRVFSPMTVSEIFADLELVSFAAVDDAGAFHPQAIPRDYERARFACGMFEFTKK